MEPKIYYKDVKFRLRKTKEIKNWIIQVIRSENKEPGDLYFIFTPDNYMIEINREFLKRDYYTDVIAFDYSEENKINGEIYIGIETVKRNAKIYKTYFINEVVRVMLHGVLHLLGYDDKEEYERKKMKEMENLYMKEIAGQKDGI